MTLGPIAKRSRRHQANDFTNHATDFHKVRFLVARAHASTCRSHKINHSSSDASATKCATTQKEEHSQYNQQHTHNTISSTTLTTTRHSTHTATTSLRTHIALTRLSTSSTTHTAIVAIARTPQHEPEYAHRHHLEHSLNLHELDHAQHN